MIAVVSHTTIIVIDKQVQSNDVGTTIENSLGMLTQHEQTVSILLLFDVSCVFTMKVLIRYFLNLFIFEYRTLLFRVKDALVVWKNDIWKIYISLHLNHVLMSMIRRIKVEITLKLWSTCIYIVHYS